MRPALTVAVASLLGAEALHAAAYVEHRSVWVWAGAFFAAVCVAEWLSAWALLTRPGGTRAAWWAIVLSLATVSVWITSRTVGLPFGPEASSPEPLGWADSICAGLEMSTAVAAARLIRGRTTGTRRIHRLRLTHALAVAAIGGLTVFGVLAPETAPHEPIATAADSGPQNSH